MVLEKHDYNFSNPDKVINPDPHSFKGEYLSYDGLLTIQNNIFSRKSAWQKGYILKWNDSLIYLKSNIRIVSSDKIEL